MNINNLLFILQMGRDMYINGESSEDFGAGRHCSHILTGLVSRNEILKYMSDTIDEIKNGTYYDVDDALKGISAMAKIAEEHTNVNPYIKTDFSQLDENTQDALIKESNIDEKDDMIWYVKNNDNVENLICNLKETYNDGHRIVEFKDLNITDYVKLAVKKFNIMKSHLNELLSDAADIFDTDNCVTIRYD